MWLLKSSLPGSVPFLLATLAVGLVLLRWPRTHALGRRWLYGLLALYLVFSLPFGSQIVAAPLSWGFSPIQNTVDARGASAIVVLDGGTARCAATGRLVERANDTTVLRAMEALRIAPLLGEPLIVVTGGLETPVAGWSLEGESLRQEIVRGGIPPERVLLDSTSKNTRAHAEVITELLRERGVARFVLVTSATHIRRATAAFRVEGSDPVPSPALTQCDGNLRRWLAFWPTPSALAASEGAMHDYLGLLYYWWRGWV